MNDVLVAIENVGNMETTKLEKGLPCWQPLQGGALCWDFRNSNRDGRLSLIWQTRQQTLI